MGFDCGTSIAVTCEEERVVIIPREKQSFVDVLDEDRSERIAKAADEVGIAVNSQLLIMVDCKIS